jgi:hypothetical protein
LNKIFHFALVAISCSLSIAAFADVLKTPADARSLADKVMAKVGAGDATGGLQLAKPYLIIPESEFGVVLEQVKLQEPVLARRFGSTIGTEYLRTDAAGENLLRIVYVHRFEKHPMRWSFYFYRGKQGWVLNSFKSDDDIRQFFAP